MKKVWLAVLALLLLTACSKNRGELAFAVVDESLMTELEKRYFVPRSFRKMRQPVIFPAGSKIWFAYKPPWQLYGARVYAFSLQKRSLGFMEIDLRNITLTKEMTHLVDFYENLPPGDYRLKIADLDGIILEYDFEISESDNMRTLDYDKDPEEDLTAEDDIISLSQ